ncbi:phage putative head morphogenesis protein, SPP1 gp7 family [Candidatus Methanoperedens nitroreducens]|uniref:Phage putative head morphogenesis protein, SPP1 gp7 family n=1 Tax=Candidatus Methanoperedens nitratireducens TaxID=1392998 RepID=A0A062UX83_9EURY|nr:phage head morphogenesis protein [Candidatus Methanoperedens nitroreducens]KCZ71606.1 phage putative head morphogenesis protein, SPP1 gp7 family [Candidatus Methanoperedens nitroreducens]MDJ1421237.1 phage head morphogenesis protein [Candidatus Methanoperedens sp.]
MRLSTDTRKEPTHTRTIQNSYAVALRRLFRSYKKQAVEALKQSEGRTLAAADVNTPWLADRLRDLATEIIILPGKRITDDYVRKSYQSGTTYAGFGLTRAGIEVSVGANTPADWRAIDALRVRNLSALKGISDEQSKQIIEQLTTGIQRGEGIPELAGRITDRVDHIGIQRATVMARTETINAFTQGTIIRYQQHDIEETEFITAQDERVCPVCGPLDGKVFRLDSDHVVPPVHPQCRCVLLPIISKE